MNTILATLLLAAETPATSSGNGAPPAGGIGSFLPFILIIVAMYFLMIAPQRKKQKQHQAMLASLESGDEVLTNGGIFGKITNKKEDRFVLQIADGTKIELAKGYVQALVKKAGASGEPAGK
ncbi:MAG: preprotein translocase subunit YajC [Opitutaceae bacterium]|nr:preprotein translocase subunit YajC [Opitutaceae bacterium]